MEHRKQNDGKTFALAVQALSDYYEEGADPTDGATHFNLRSNNSRKPFMGFGISTQNGPFTNSFPTQGLKGSGVYVNTYR